MNKEYKKAFSLVAPRNEAIERIFNMTKKRKIRVKPLLIAAAVITAGIVSMFTANAATDGEVFEAIENSPVVVAIENNKVVQDFMQDFGCIINGKKLTADDCEINHEQIVDESGKTIDRFEIEVTNENGEVDYQIEVLQDYEGLAIGAGGNEPLDSFKLEYNDGTDNKEIEMPTTAVAE